MIRVRFGATVFYVYVSGINCWVDGYTADLCCPLAKGPYGELSCWDPSLGMTQETCCHSYYRERALEVSCVHALHHKELFWRRLSGRPSENSAGRPRDCDRSGGRFAWYMYHPELEADDSFLFVDGADDVLYLQRLYHQHMIHSGGCVPRDCSDAHLNFWLV